MRLLNFLSSAPLRTVDPNCALGSSRELAVLRSFTQLVSWADYSELASCHNGLDGHSTHGRARHYPGIQAVSSAQRAATSSVADSDPLSSTSCPDAVVDEEGLQAPQLIDVHQLMDAMKGLNLPAAALSAIMDAVRESIVAAAGGGGLDAGHVSRVNCRCCGLAQECSHPSTPSKILDSSLARDPETLLWLQTTLGVQP
eukprot:jgi/Mesvir1/2750/Mv14368-RA.1